MEGRAWRVRVRLGAVPLAFVAALAGGVGCDASSPCANVGCAAPPVCPGTCSSECGCCSCSSGTRECLSDGIYECTGFCRQRVKACAPDACVQLRDGTAICAETIDDCAVIKRAYEEAVARFSSAQRERSVEPGMPTLKAGSYSLFDTSCERATGCTVQMGHCEDGLGGPCWYLAESGQPLDHYAALYQRLGCATPTTCDCPAANIDVSCQDDQIPTRCVVR